MTILVTGGAGFIGSHLCWSLLNQGETIVCIDNFDPFYPPKSKRSNVDRLSTFENFIFYEANAANAEVMSSIIERHSPVRQVFHLAGRGGLRQSVNDPFPYLEGVLGTTLTVLEMCTKHGIGRFVNASSSSVYGSIQATDDRKVSNADAPTAPYAAFKRSAELLGYSYHHIHGIMCVNARLFSVYGPRGRPDQIIYKIAQHIVEDIDFTWFEPEPIRDFTYVSDIVDGLIATLNLPDELYCTIDLGSGDPQSLSAAISILEKELDKELPISPETVNAPRSDFPFSGADIERTSEFIDWTPKVSLTEGIHRFVSWFRPKL